MHAHEGRDCMQHHTRVRVRMPHHRYESLCHLASPATATLVHSTINILLTPRRRRDHRDRAIVKVRHNTTVSSSVQSSPDQCSSHRRVGPERYSCKAGEVFGPMLATAERFHAEKTHNIRRYSSVRVSPGSPAPATPPAQVLGV